MINPRSPRVPPWLPLLASSALLALGCGSGSSGSSGSSAGTPSSGNGGAGGSTASAQGGSPESTGGGGVVASYAFSPIAAFNGPGRDSAVAFVIGEQGYVGTGTSPSSGPPYYKDFWRYDPVSNIWQAVAELPGEARVDAVAFTVGEHGYVGLGRRNDTKFADFWRYDPAANAWAQLSDFPVATYSASSFVIDDIAYVIDSAGALRGYGVATDVWTERAPFRGKARSSGVAFTLAGKGYFGTGFVEGGSAITSTRYADLWQYDPGIDRWTRVADLPTGSLSGGVSFSIGEFGFVGSGNDFSGAFAQFFRYDPSSDSWAVAGNYPPGGANGMVAFAIGQAAFIGTGYWSRLGLLGGDAAAFYRFAQK